MQGSKIRLSPSELSLFCNADIILTKNSILQKTVSLLAGVQEKLLAETTQFHPTSSPKISRGENYLGLPYVVLDYPRISTGENLCFIRSMFWWGHFFSSTLQLAGSFKEENELKLTAAYPALCTNGYYVGTDEDPWQHHFEATNYLPVSSLSQEVFYQTLQKQPHIKIAAKWPLSQWDSAATLLWESWRFFANLVA